MYAFVHVSAASPDAMQPVEALLDVSAYPDQAISTISFNFWHRLMRRLVLGEHSTSAQQDGEVITSHSQDPAMNSHSAVRIPPRHNSPPLLFSHTHTTYCICVCALAVRLFILWSVGFLDGSA